LRAAARFRGAAFLAGFAPSADFELGFDAATLFRSASIRSTTGASATGSGTVISSPAS